MTDLDKELTRHAKRLANLGDDLADAEQAFERSQRAASELSAFSDAGVEKLNHVTSDLRRWQDFADAVSELVSDVNRIVNSAKTIDLPEIGAEPYKVTCFFWRD